MTVTNTVKRLGKPNQDFLLRFIGQYIKKNGYAPAIQEMAELCGFSYNTTYLLLEALEDAGRIEREKGRYRTIRVVRKRRTA